MRSCKTCLLVLALALLVGCAGPASAKTYVVCVGIQNYPKRMNDLTLPALDAAAMKQLFEQNGDSEVYLITDAKATRANITATVRRCFAKAKAGDAVVFFYCGHGSKGALYTYDGNLNYNVLWKLMLSNKATRRMAFINACYSGSMRNTYDYRKLKGKNMLLFLSSRTGETSLEKMTMKNGVFTSSLLKALHGKADANGDHIITAKELFNYVSRDVKELSGDRQHPVMYGGFKDNMTIIKWK